MSSSATRGEADSPSPEVEPSVLVTLRVKDSEGVRITRTMRRTDKLRDLTDFYLAMVVPAAVAQGHVCRPVGVFMHYGRRVTGYETPADYDMDDGDEVSFFPDRVMSLPVTLTVKDSKGRTVTRTMRRIEKLNVLFDLYHAMFRVPWPQGLAAASVTRTMHRTDKLQDLIDFYEAMVPADKYCDGECQVVYGGKTVEGEKTPADCEMEDGDQIKRMSSMFVTVTVGFVSLGKNIEHAHTLRRTDKLQGLMDLCSSMMPSRYKHGCRFLFDGRFVLGSQTPDDLAQEDVDMIDLTCY
uniref:Rad60/SUMO-like domain-containing protein n=1 Tax=Oryza nivara TaxID=4536 RepID=A0A0E0I2P1_ORYNI